LTRTTSGFFIRMRREIASCRTPASSRKKEPR
jgi:hypothetical protein